MRRWAPQRNWPDTYPTGPELLCFVSLNSATLTSVCKGLLILSQTHRYRGMESAGAAVASPSITSAGQLFRAYSLTHRRVLLPGLRQNAAQVLGRELGVLIHEIQTHRLAIHYRQRMA